MKFAITDRCVGCGLCQRACHGACIDRTESGSYAIDQSRCLECGSCMTVCPMSAILEEGDSYTRPAHDPVTIQADLVVLGAGAAGLVAAARAAAASDLRVVVLEKMPFIGGGMNFASDWRIYNSDWQARRGIPNLMQKKIQQAMDATNWQLDGQLVYQAYANTGKFFDWFETIVPEDCEFEEGMYIFDQPHGGQIIPFIKGWRGVGRYSSRVLREYCLSHGVQILTRCKAEGITLTEGKISAVTASDPGGQVTVMCKAVILATGSWIHNRELIRQYAPDYARVHVAPNAHTSVAYTGDGLTLGQQAGARMDPSTLVLRLMGPMGMVGGAASAFRHSPAAIYVNKNGRRWINENTHIRTDNTFGLAQVLVQQPEGVSFALFEREMAEKFAARNGNAPIPTNADEHGPVYIPEDWAAQLDEMAQPGGVARVQSRFAPPGMPGVDMSTSVIVGNTLEELAEKAGIDPAGLRETVENYNRMCAEGFDSEFFKDPEQLIPFGCGPFYAVRGDLATDGGFGGFPIDKDTRAYAAADDGSVVPGLYVPGDLSASRFLNYNGVKVQVINDLAWAVSSGFSAAEHAVAFIREQREQ